MSTCTVRVGKLHFAEESEGCCSVSGNSPVGPLRELELYNLQNYVIWEGGLWLESQQRCTDLWEFRFPMQVLSLTATHLPLSAVCAAVGRTSSR